jgi:hypothetical protein
MRRVTNATYDGASPSELMKIAAIRGPKATNHGRRIRSERSPKSGCEKDEVTEESATSAPTSVRFKPSF